MLSKQPFSLLQAPSCAWFGGFVKALCCGSSAYKQHPAEGGFESQSGESGVRLHQTEESHLQPGCQACGRGYMKSLCIKNLSVLECLLRNSCWLQSLCFAWHWLIG